MWPRGQALSEFTISLIIVLVVCFGVQIYVKRGLQGRYKDIVDEGTAPIAQWYNAYDPYYQSSSTTVARDERVQEAMSRAGALRREFPASEYDAVSNRWSDSVDVKSESTDNTNVEGGNLVWQY